MKYLLWGLSLLITMSTAKADFDFFNNNGKWVMGPYGPYYEESDWPKWTPMYWMEEMFDSFDDNEYSYGNGFGHGYNRNRGFNYFNSPPFWGNNAFRSYGMNPYIMPPMQPYPYMPAPAAINTIPMPPYPYTTVPSYPAYTVPNLQAPINTTAGPANNKAP